MGVKGLWEVLAPVKTSMDLDELTGQTVAVDLSCWLCQCRSVADLRPTQYLRTLFYRITCLLRLGVKLVFVMDGTPPKLKMATMSKRRIGHSPISPRRRLQFNNSHSVEKTRQMLEYLSIPCLQAHGEAEALCALLSQTGLVDGCITQDGDALLYGAQRVYKNFTMDKQDSHVDSYRASDIEGTLGLTREDLVTLALLTGCDYDQEGVKHVGPDKALRLIKHLKSGHDSPLHRICSWRDCDDLDLAVPGKGQMECHCSYCHHPGTIVSHKSEGCSVCTTRVKCLRDKNQRCPCPCDWHVHERRLKENSLEMKVREKALQYPSFPNTELLKEFLENSEKVDGVHLVWRKPTLTDFMNCAKILNWGSEQALTKVLPTLVSCDIRARLDRCPNSVTDAQINLLQPKCIVKVCQKDFQPCYEVQWSRLGEDIWSPNESTFYTTVVEQRMFTQAFKDLVKSFEWETERLKSQKSPMKSHKAKGKKRKRSEENGKTAYQTPLTDFFGIKKKGTVVKTTRKNLKNKTDKSVICID